MGWLIEGSPGFVSVDPLFHTKRVPMSHQKAKSCPISRDRFRTHAPAGSEVVAKIADAIDLKAMEFSTGGFGYGGTGKIVLNVAGVPVKTVVMISAMIVDSKYADDSTQETG